MAILLTKGQERTLVHLNKKEYSDVKQADITRLLKRMLDRKITATEIVPKVIDYEKVKFPSKSLDEIQKFLAKKLKSGDDRKMFREVLAQGDFTSFDKPIKTPPKPTVDKAPTSTGRNDAPSQPNGKASELTKILDRLLSDDTKVEEPFQGKGVTVGDQTDAGIDLSQLFKTGSKLYKDNKSTIDKLKRALTPQKLDDGSWLTDIASFEFPELQLLQKVVNLTPLGFSTHDKDNFAKMLSRDPTKMGQVSTSDGLRLVAKMLVNPDEIGVLIKTRGEQLAGDALEGIEKWGRKITGQAPLKDPNIGSLEDLIDARRASGAKKSKRQEDLDRLNGIPPKEKIPPEFSTADIGGEDRQSGISAGGVVHTTTGIPALNDRSNMTAEQILAPPHIPGFVESTWYDDLFGWFKDLVVPDFSGSGTDQEKYLRSLKEHDPESYNRYQKSMKQYEKTKTKLTLTKGSDVNLSIHKDLLQNTFDFSRELLEKASSLKELTSQEIETIYDISGTLEDVMSGSRTISYDDLAKIQRAIFSKIPAQVLADSDIDGFVDTMKSSLDAMFDGDSKLADDYDYISDLKTDAEATADIDTDDKKPEEKKGDDDKEKKTDDDRVPEEDPDDPTKPTETGKVTEVRLNSNKPDSKKDWPHLRPRMKWGGTNELFMREKNEVQQANLIAEAMSVEQSGWGNLPDNPLYKRNLIQDQMRYGRTYSMPSPPPSNPTTLPQSFIKMTQPIMLPQYAPNTNTYADVGRDPELYGQYQRLRPAQQMTVYPALEQINQPREYPFVADEGSGGLELPPSTYNYLQNLRFT
jgi:hypothetical protein